MTEWISVKDRLPIVGEDRWAVECLVYVLKYNMQKICWFSVGNFHEKICEAFSWYQKNKFNQEPVHKTNSPLDTVTHWMYLPNLPKEYELYKFLGTGFLQSEGKNNE